MLDIARVLRHAEQTVIVVPRPHPTLVTRRVLLMERLHGFKYDDVDGMRAAGIDTEAVLRSLLICFIEGAMIYGVFDVVPESDKAAALDAFMEALAPGRSREARPGNAKELAATTVLRIALDEASCKVRTGGPNDDDEDLALPVWAGVLPLALTPRAPIAAAAPGEIPDYVRDWHGAVRA